MEGPGVFLHASCENITGILAMGEHRKAGHRIHTGRQETGRRGSLWTGCPGARPPALNADLTKHQWPLPAHPSAWPLGTECTPHGAEEPSVLRAVCPGHPR